MNCSRLISGVASVCLLGLVEAHPGNVRFSSFQDPQVKQERNSKQGDVTVRLEPGTAAPGGKLTVSIYLKTDSPIEVTSVRFEVSFPSEFLSFENAEPSLRNLEQIADNFRAELKPVQGERAILSVEASNDGKDKVIPSGPMGYLAFKIPSDVLPGQLVKLEVQNLNAITTSSELLQSARAGESEVIVLDLSKVPVPSCFFYMH